VTTPRTTIRVEPDLIAQAATRHGLDVRNVSHVVRMALALMAGAPNAREVAHLPQGRRGPRPARRLAA
jgi:hypothetical protein